MKRLSRILSRPRMRLFGVSCPHCGEILRRPGTCSRRYSLFSSEWWDMMGEKRGDAAYRALVAQAHCKERTEE